MFQDEVVDALALLRAAGTDTQHVEAKSQEGGWSKSVLDSISAFANTSGGLILLGVDEETDFSVVEIDAAALADRLANACRGEIEPPVSVHIEIVPIEGKQVVAGRVDELPADQKPAFVKAKGMNNGSFLRLHDGDRRLTTYEISILLSNRTQPRYDEEIVDGALRSDLDDSLVDGLLQRVRVNKPSTFGELSDDDALRRLGVLLEEGDHMRPSLAGLLALGSYPQRWYPQLNVVVVAYPTNDNKPLADGTRFLDNVAVDGPVPRLVEDAIAAIRRNLSRRTRVQSLLREDEWDYPIEVIRELVVNALMHRDLSPAARGTQVRVEIYPDRLTVTNPGGLFGPVTPADLGVVTVSSSRNARLAKLLEDTALVGSNPVAENRGSGFITLTRRLESVGMAKPVVRDGISEFQVRLQNTSLLDDVALEELKQWSTEGWTDLERLTVALASREGDVTNERLREVTGEHSADVGVAFVRLSDLGVLRRRGSGRGSRWELGERDDKTPDSREDTSTNQLLDLAPSKAEVTDPPPQLRTLLNALEGDAQSSTDLTETLGLGTKRNVLYWIARAEDSGWVEPTEEHRKSTKNKWRLTSSGQATLAGLKARGESDG